MTPTEHTTKTPFATAGLSAVLGAVLRAGGTGAPAGLPVAPKGLGPSRCALQGAPTRRPLLAAFLASLCALTAALAIAPASAQALVYTGISFGPDGTSETAFQQPSAVGVDQSTGTIYVQDSAANTIEKFNSKHEPEAFNPLAPNVNLEGRLTGFAFTTTEPSSQLAVDSTSHDFYVVNIGANTVRAYQSDGQPADFSVGPDKGTNELGGFERVPCGVATDSNGDIYVGVFNNGIHVYAPSGEPLLTIPIGPNTTFVCNVTVDSKGAVYVDNSPFSGLGVAKLTPSEFPVTSSTTYAEVGTVDANPGFGVAVDPATNVLYVDEHTQAASFEEGGTFVEAFGASGSPGALTASEGLAVDSAAGEVYVSDAQGAKQVEVFGAKVLVPTVAIEPASDVSETAMTLHGSVTPEGNTVTECFFEYGETTAYGHRAQCEPAAGAIPEAGTTPTPVSATVSGLPAARVRHFRLVAASASGAARSGDRSIKRPAVVSESVSHVSNDSARLETEVSPQGLDTSYEFSYGPCGAGECTVPVPSADIGAGTTPVPLSNTVQGLQSNTTYHYRVLARNALGQESGPDQTFTTERAGEFVLPDDRQWQMVSPPQKQGALFEPILNSNVIEAAADGHAFTYVANAPTEAGPAGYVGESQVFSVRGGDGWQSRDLVVPHERDTGVVVGAPGEYRLFSRDLSQAAVQPLGHLISCSEGRVPPACMSPAASVQGSFLQDTSTGVLAPLVTGCLAGVECPLAVQENANEPPGVLSEGENCGVPTRPCGVGVEGAAPDFAHVILGGLTEWSAGVHGLEQLRPVGLLPPPYKEGKAVPAEGAHLGLVGEANGYDVRNAVSSDGSRVVFQASVEGSVHLYMRVNALQSESGAEGERCTEPALACTVQVNAGLEGEPVFQTASDTGSRVFFTEVGGPDSGDLFVYEAGAAKPEPVPVATGTGVVGTVLGASEDGSWVYFVSNSKLAAGAVNGTCQASGFGNGVCNLYVAHNGGGGWEAPRLVTVLSGQDQPDWAGKRPAEFPDLQSLTARVSPDGRWLAFMSQRSLTGYDNRDLASGQPDEEVYEYHAPERLESEGGVLACASCNPTGERPHGIEDSAHPLIDSDFVWTEGNQSLAANVPGWTPFFLGDAAYQSRYLSDGGRLFFNAVDALVPQDTNGVADVYEFEPQGDGTCAGSASSGSVVFKPARAFMSEAEGVRLAGVEPAGCVALLSSGSSAQESVFLDASESGSDVFFLTTSKLAPQDFDSARDVYDAHECTTESPCLPEPAATPPACETEASCKAAPIPQPTIYQAPPSATFSGPGNLVPPPPVKPAVKKKTVKCKRGFVKKKVKKKEQCVKQKKPRHSSKRKGK